MPLFETRAHVTSLERLMGQRSGLSYRERGRGSIHVAWFVCVSKAHPPPTPVCVREQTKTPNPIVQQTL